MVNWCISCMVTWQHFWVTWLAMWQSCDQWPWDFSSQFWIHCSLWWALTILQYIYVYIYILNLLIHTITLVKLTMTWKERVNYEGNLSYQFLYAFWPDLHQTFPGTMAEYHRGRPALYTTLAQHVSLRWSGDLSPSSTLSPNALADVAASHQYIVYTLPKWRPGSSRQLQVL